MSELNIKSSTIEKSLDLAKDFLQKLVGPSVDEIGLFFSDNVKIWRLKNQIKNLEKVKRIVEENNIPLKKVNLKILLPYLDGVSMEEDDDLQNMWANLFVNYIDPEKNLTTNVYPNILSQLSSLEVKILNYLDEHGTLHIGYREDPKICVREDLTNLERLGLLKETLKISKYGTDSTDYEELTSDEFYLSRFGLDFLLACKR